MRGDGAVRRWRDALSGQSCELSVAKANEAVAFGNAEVGGGPFGGNRFGKNHTKEKGNCILAVGNKKLIKNWLDALYISVFAKSF